MGYVTTRSPVKGAGTISRRCAPSARLDLDASPHIRSLAGQRWAAVGSPACARTTDTPVLRPSSIPRGAPEQAGSPNPI